jgi:hypothetical protein
VALPIVQNLLARSPYLHAADKVDAQIAARTLLPPPAPSTEPGFTAPAPLPVVDTPLQFARDFIKERTDHADAPPKPKPKPKKPIGRRPIGDLKPAHDRFRVVDGDGDNEADPKR